MSFSYQVDGRNGHTDWHNAMQSAASYGRNAWLPWCRM